MGNDGNNRDAKAEPGGAKRTLDYATPEPAQNDGSRAVVALVAAGVAILLPLLVPEVYDAVPRFNPFLASLCLGSSAVALWLGIVVLQRSSDERNRRRAGFALMLAGCAALGVLMQVPDMIGRRPPGVDPVLSDRFKHVCAITEGLEKYRRQHEGRFPARLEDLVTEGFLPAEALICPGTSPAPASGSGTTQPAGGVTPPQVSHVYLGGSLPARRQRDVVVLYERLDVRAQQPGIFVIWGDGDMRIVRGKRERKLLAELESGHNPPRKEAIE